jgi:F420-0:gamma-glutamyl ligase-like protein
MTKPNILALTTKYWRPKTDYLKEISEAIEGKIDNGDFLVISEKALSTALNNIVDESSIKPSSSARFIAVFWMRTVWGYFLSRLCHLRKLLTIHLRRYPVEAGGRHKQVALQHVGLLQALMFGSEGGIDGSNLPYSYISLPLCNDDNVAEKIRTHVQKALQKSVSVIVVDTDKTYSFRNFHFAPRSTSVKGIHPVGGVISFVVGRMLKLKRRATPVAIAGSHLSTEEILRIADVANRARGVGAGRTVWDMARRFRVGLTEVTWEMLDTVKHKPIVIVKGKR